MSAPFLPLFNVLQGSTAGSSTGLAGSIASGAPGEGAGGGESFVQSLARMQGKEGDPGIPADFSSSSSVTKVNLQNAWDLAPPTQSSLELILGAAGDGDWLTQPHTHMPSELWQTDSPLSVGILAADSDQPVLMASSEASVAPGYEIAEESDLLAGHPFHPLFSPPAPMDGRVGEAPLPLKGAEGGSQAAQLLWGAGQQPLRSASPINSAMASSSYAERSAMVAPPSAETPLPQLSMELGRQPLLPVEERSMRGGPLEEGRGGDSDLKPLVLSERPSATVFSSAAAARVAVPVQVAFGQPQWATAVAERTAMLAGQSVQYAELKLDPPELGPLNVRISLNQEQASVHFISANLSVREALDQSMVRLRELLQEQGLDLVDTGVSDQAPEQDNAQDQGHKQAAPKGSEQVSDVDTDSPRPTTIVSAGIDDFV